VNINEFISSYKNHPVLFVGTGISLRYLKNSYTWDSLLCEIAYELKENTEFYLDIKSKSQVAGKYKFDKVASLLEKEFNENLSNDRNGKFKDINDIFYENMEKGINLSRLKIYISKKLSNIEYKEDMQEEIKELKKIRKNIGSIVTTNYDKLVENIFEFNPLIGNNILLSNPYGSVYKIHGCISNPEKIIITEDDYQDFIEKYELIRAQLLSLFIHNPIIFIGYSISDENIKNILKTIFTYIDTNSDDAKKIRKNFLLVEYDEEVETKEILEHDIDLEGFPTIRINKIKTSNFKPIYKSLSELHLPVSAMDVRKVQNIVKEIYSGGEIKVNITEDLDSLNNSDKIIAIGSSKTISYQYQSSAEMMSNYFKIIDESNDQLLSLIDKYNIQKSQYFPVFGFSTINITLEKSDRLKKIQVNKINQIINSIPDQCKNSYTSIKEIENDKNITQSNKSNAIVWAIIKNNVDLGEIEQYLREHDNKTGTNCTDYRKQLCAYDLKKYS
jgi:hypothetical protein